MTDRAFVSGDKKAAESVASAGNPLSDPKSDESREFYNQLLRLASDDPWGTQTSAGELHELEC